MTCVTCGEPTAARDRKYAGPCAVCGADTCPKHTYFHTDESNVAITNSARPMCETHKGER